MHGDKLARLARSLPMQAKYDPYVSTVSPAHHPLMQVTMWCASILLMGHQIWTLESQQAQSLVRHLLFLLHPGTLLWMHAGLRGRHNHFGALMSGELHSCPDFTPPHVLMTLMHVQASTPHQSLAIQKTWQTQRR